MDTVLGNSRDQGHPTIPQLRTARKSTSWLSGGQNVVLLQFFIGILMRGWSGGCFTTQLPCSVKQRKAPKWLSWWLAALPMSRFGLWTAIWAVLRVPHLTEEKLSVPLLTFPQALCSLGPSLMAQAFALESVHNTEIAEGAEWDVTLFWAVSLCLAEVIPTITVSGYYYVAIKSPYCPSVRRQPQSPCLLKACILAPLMYLSRFLLQPL